MISFEYPASVTSTKHIHIQVQHPSKSASLPFFFTINSSAFHSLYDIFCNFLSFHSFCHHSAIAESVIKFTISSLSLSLNRLYSHHINCLPTCSLPTQILSWSTSVHLHIPHESLSGLIHTDPFLLSTLVVLSTVQRLVLYDPQQRQMHRLVPTATVACGCHFSPPKFTSPIFRAVLTACLLSGSQGDYEHLCSFSTC